MLPKNDGIKFDEHVRLYLTYAEERIYDERS